MLNSNIFKFHALQESGHIILVLIKVMVRNATLLSALIFKTKDQMRNQMSSILDEYESYQYSFLSCVTAVIVITIHQMMRREWMSRDIRKNKGILFEMIKIAIEKPTNIWKKYQIKYESKVVGGKHIDSSLYNEKNDKLRRKKEFLQNIDNKRAYGYRNSEAGYIDNWRHLEFPGLIHPLANEVSNDYRVSKKSVYLDFAGAALPTQSQLRDLYEQAASVKHQMMGNPHSTYSTSIIEIERAKRIILEFFGCSDDSYDLIFTSGTTDALRTLASHFPWQKESKFLYARNSHTSVVGIRNIACFRGGSFKCFSIDKLLGINADMLTAWCDDSTGNNNPIIPSFPKSNLLAFPLECNASGDSINEKYVRLVTENIRKFNDANVDKKIYTLVDIAKAASTGRVSITEMDVDFACLSFYKLFGTPTGIGALIMKKSSSAILLNNIANEHNFFGGGAVDAILPDENFMVPRNNLHRLVNGTTNYRSIAELGIGINILERLGGMDAIASHSRCLAQNFVQRLRNLKHPHGKPAIIIYGKWGSLNHQTNHADNGVSSNLIPGATVTFNVIRHDGSLVGYSEVSKLAELSSPQIRFRTGCFCNTGFCQSALNLGNDQIKMNFASGHVCGDENDIVNNRPTGAVRISFGKDSLWEDLDETIMFLQHYFVRSDITFDEHMKSSISCEIERSQKCQPAITDIYVFPIKSCGAMRVNKWKICGNGKLLFDREFALVDSSGTALRLNSYPKMTLISPTINVEENILTVRAPCMDDLLISLKEKSFGLQSSKDIYVCGHECNSIMWGDKYVSNWFTSVLGIRCWLVRSSISNKAKCNASQNRKAFANEAPLLLLSRESVNILNSVLLYRGEEPVDPRYFRPNLVVNFPIKSSKDRFVSSPEDFLEAICVTHQDSLRQSKYIITGKCSRCSMVDYCPSTGSKGKTLSALAEYRREKGRIFFGVFLKMDESLDGDVLCDHNIVQDEIQVGDWIEYM